MLFIVVVCAVDVEVELGSVLYLVVQQTPRLDRRSVHAINTLVLSLAVTTTDKFDPTMADYFAMIMPNPKHLKHTLNVVVLSIADTQNAMKMILYSGLHDG